MTAKDLLNELLENLKTLPLGANEYLQNEALSDEERIAMIAEDMIDLGNTYLRSL